MIAEVVRGDRLAKGAKLRIEIGALLLLVLTVLLEAVRAALRPPGQRSWRSIRGRSVDEALVVLAVLAAAVCGCISW